MEPGKPSATARGVALLRAVHQIIDQPRVLDDPVILRLLGDEVKAILARPPGERRPRGLTGLRAAIVVRSRFAEDRLALAVQRGVKQCVILGAGLDTFGWRNPHQGLKVLEVDYPATQAWKRAELERVGLDPGAVTFVPVDFEHDTLADALARAGFDAAAPAFFTWLGVTMYLTREAIDETLRFVASCPKGSEIVFSYATTVARAASRAAESGEPWKTLLDPDELDRDLRRLGFTELDDLRATEGNRRYFADRSDNLRLKGQGGVMAARV